jgi:hypothetical protein
MSAPPAALGARSRYDFPSFSQWTLGSGALRNSPRRKIASTLIEVSAGDVVRWAESATGAATEAATRSVRRRALLGRRGGSVKTL